MNKKTKSFLLISALLLLASCSLSNDTLNPKIGLDKNLTELNQKDMGIVNVKVEGNLFKKGFSTKSTNFVNPLINKLMLEVKGIELTKPMIQTIKWNPGESVSFNIPVLKGKNRIAILTALDSGNRILGKYMGIVDVEAGKTNNAKISYFDTAVAQVLYPLITSGTENDEFYFEFVNSIDSNQLSDYVKYVTGFNPDTNRFSRIDPASLNTTKIATSIFSTGFIPEKNHTEDELLEFEKTGSLKVASNIDGADFVLSDLNSQSVINGSKDFTIDGITLGEWDLTIMKEGYVSQTYQVTVEDGGVNSVEVNLPEDLRERVVLNNYRVAKLDSDIVDNELGLSIKNYTFTVGYDKDNNGAEDQFASASVDITGLGSHSVYFNQENFPVMSNNFDKLTIFDESINQSINLESDQELQTFGISSNNQKVLVETNFDGTFSFNGEVAKTAKELAIIMLEHPLFRDISVHNVALMYEIFKSNGKVGITVVSETLVPTSCGSGAGQLSYFNSYEQMTELLKESVILLKSRKK